MHAECKTTGTGKFTMPYLYFYDVIKTNKTEMITIELIEEKIIIGQTSFRVITKQ
jgi:hypothetical protein